MLKLVEKMYTAVTHLHGNRSGGTVKNQDTGGQLDLTISKPIEMGGKGDPGTNPEQLFAAGYSTCFGGAIAAVAKGRNVSDMEITAHVPFGKADDGGFIISVTFEVKLPHLDRATAEQIVQEAHQICPYSRATRGNIEVTTIVV
jgi:Ohr subfamily peroxiredoxin